MTIPPELIEPLIGLALAAIGYLTRLFQKRKAEKIGTAVLKEINDPMKPDEVTVYKNANAKYKSRYGEKGSNDTGGSTKSH